MTFLTKSANLLTHYNRDILQNDKVPPYLEKTRVRLKKSCILRRGLEQRTLTTIFIAFISFFNTFRILPPHRKHLASGKIDFLLVEA